MISALTDARTFLAASTLCLLCAIPFAVHAQTNLTENAIRSILARDPQAANMSQTDFDKIVNALTQQAQAQHIAPDRIATTTPQDIQFAASLAASVCTSDSAVICAIAGITGIDAATLSWYASFFLAALILILLFMVWRRLTPPHQIA